MLLAEVCHVKGVTDGPPPEYDWEIYLKETARKIIEQQTPSQVLLVRSRLYELLVRLIPPNIIFQVRSFHGIFRVNRFSATILRTEQGLRRFWNESTFSKGKNFADFSHLKFIYFFRWQQNLSTGAIWDQNQFIILKHFSLDSWLILNRSMTSSLMISMMMIFKMMFLEEFSKIKLELPYK